MSERLFFALWPPASVRAALAAGQRALGLPPARLTPPERLHMTLAFLGPVPAERREAARSAAAACRSPGFDMTIDQVGYWRRRGLVWLAPSAAPAALSRLADLLTAALAEAGFVLEARAFHPHVTVARRVTPASALSIAAPLRWAVRDFVLVASHDSARGVDYDVLERWPLDEPT